MRSSQNLISRMAALVFGCLMTTACIECGDGYAEFEGECIPEIVVTGQRPPPVDFGGFPPPPPIIGDFGGGGGGGGGSVSSPPPQPQQQEEEPPDRREQLERDRQDCFDFVGRDLSAQCGCSASFLIGNCGEGFRFNSDEAGLERCIDDSLVWHGDCLRRVRSAELRLR